MTTSVRSTLERLALPAGADAGALPLLSADAFVGGLVVNSLLALWLLERFGVWLAQAGTFFCAGLLSAFRRSAACCSRPAGSPRPWSPAAR